MAKDFINPDTGKYETYYGVATYTPCAEYPHVYKVRYTDGDQEKMMLGETRKYMADRATVPLEVTRRLNALGATPQFLKTKSN